MIISRLAKKVKKGQRYHKIKQKELVNIIKEELNVKEVEWESGKEEIAVDYDFELTPELKAEGMMRELLRLIQDTRKQAKYAFSDKVKLYFETSSDEIRKVFTKFENQINVYLH